MLPDASWPSCTKSEWEKEGDVRLAGEEKQVWWEIQTGLEVVMETVMGECQKVTGMVHNQMESIEMLEEMLCNRGNDMNTVRWTEDAVVEDACIPTLDGDIVPIGKERGRGETNGKDCLERVKVCG
jgi:hypothetical protein